MTQVQADVSSTPPCYNLPMTYVADLHTHSPYARGTSSQLTFENLARWAKFKGIDLLASGDFTHPAWFRETGEKLRDAGNGLFELGGVSFILGTEVNCVAPQGGRNRRVHLLVLAPHLPAVERINAALASRGKLGSDGRPTLRISPKDLVSLLLDIVSRCMVVPAHLWTPWFGLYGSKSGFDSIEECFEDMAGHIHAVETGLSSDPAMNWRMPSLDGVSIVSFSDAHSLPKLGRELTVFPGRPSYDGLSEALKAQNIAYTVEFFPQEGKYHYSGHRKCGVRLSPEQIDRNGRRCPTCNGLLTLGVMQRVEEFGRQGRRDLGGRGRPYPLCHGTPAIQDADRPAAGHRGEPGPWTRHRCRPKQLPGAGVPTGQRALRTYGGVALGHREDRRRASVRRRGEGPRGPGIHRARLRWAIWHGTHMARLPEVGRGVGRGTTTYRQWYSVGKSKIILDS